MSAFSRISACSFAGDPDSVHRRRRSSTPSASRRSAHLVGAAIPNQAAAIQAVALGGFLLVFLLSGLIFPVENIPAGCAGSPNIVWGRYYIEIVRDALAAGRRMAGDVVTVLMIAHHRLAVFIPSRWRSMRRMQVKV